MLVDSYINKSDAELLADEVKFNKKLFANIKEGRELLEECERIQKDHLYCNISKKIEDYLHKMSTEYSVYKASFVRIDKLSHKQCACSLKPCEQLHRVLEFLDLLYASKQKPVEFKSAAFF